MRRRVHTRRARRFNKTYADLGKWLIATAEEIWRRSAGLDTSVRDSVAEGLAYIVSAANDCTAQNLDLTVEQWMSWIDQATADWFRARGFAEWFCIAAASGFRKSRPRILSDLHIKYRKAKPRKKRVKPEGIVN